MKPTIIVAAFAVAGVLLVAGILAAFWPSIAGESDKSATITVPETKTVVLGTTNTINGQLMDQEGAAIARETIKISAVLPDGSLGSSSTVSTGTDGEFTFALSPSQPGTYTLTVTFDGNDDCKPTTATMICVVIYNQNQTPTVLSLSGSGTAQTGSVENVAGILQTTDSKAVPGATVTVQVTNPDGSKRNPASVTTGSDGKFALAITPATAGSYQVLTTYAGDAAYGPSSSTFSFSAAGGDVTPAPSGGEPSLWMEYTTSWSGDAISYGMPSPGSNKFTIETNKYGEDQPDGPVRITHFIHISDVEPRSGDVGPAEGSCEIRTYNPNSQVSRLVNLYDDGKGGAFGILVDTYATWDYTWTFEDGKSEKFTQTFSVNITKLGSHTVDVYAVHDHGDGTAVEVSNHLTRTFVTNAQSLVGAGYNYLSFYKNTYRPTMSWTQTFERSNYQSTPHGPLPYTYSGQVHLQLFMQGTTGYSLSVNGQPFMGVSTTVNGVAGTLYDLGYLNSGDRTTSFSMSITVTDAVSHSGSFILKDVATGQSVGSGSLNVYAYN